MLIKEVQSKLEDILLPEGAYDEFVSFLTVNKIKQFNSECKKKHLDIKNIKRSPNSSDGLHLNREGFLSLMHSVFGKEYKKESSIKKDERNIKSFTTICNKMFNRFKIVNCDIKSERPKGSNHQEYFYVNDISNDEQEIDAYEYTCALCMFPKIDFKEKMNLLFHVTDADDDGYINEEEIRNMIFVVNFLFCDEEATLGSNSSIINQSLANIKSGQILNMIMKYPGDLYRVLTSEKYIDFDQFYTAISKIENFRYTIIPSFINFKSALNTRKNEPDFEIERKNLNDFLSITNEIVSHVKTANCEIIKGSKDIKKLISAKAESKAEMLIKKKKNFVDENIKYLKLKGNNKMTNEDTDGFQTSENTNTNISNLPNIFVRLRKEKINSFKFHPKEIQNSSLIHHESNNLNYNKIINLEAHPGKIKLKDNTTYRENRTDSTTINEREFAKLQFRKEIVQTHKEENKKVYIPFAEIMQEIRELSYQKNNANNEDTEEVRRVIKATRQQGNQLKGKLKDTGTTSSLHFGNFSKKGVV